MAKYFRFEDLEIWKEAIKIACELFEIADELETKKLWRFADQLRGAGPPVIPSPCYPCNPCLHSHC